MAADGDDATRVKDAIEALREAMEAGFAGLRSDMDKLRYEFKPDIEKFEREMKELKHGLNWTQEDVARLREKALWNCGWAKKGKITSSLNNTPEGKICDSITSTKRVRKIARRSFITL